MEAFPALPQECSDTNDSGVAECSFPRGCGDHFLKRGFEDGAYSDVIVKCFDKEYELHKIVIDQCEYFRSMLSMNWACGEQDYDGRTKLTLFCDDPGVTPRGIEFVLKAMYSLDLELSPDLFVSALSAAMFLQFTAFIEKYTSNVDAIAKSITPASCGGILAFAYDRELDTLSNMCMEYLAGHLCMLPGESLKCVPSSCLIKLLEEEYLHAPRGEYDRYVVVKLWLEGNPNYALTAGDARARERVLEINHVREKLIRSIQFGSINNAQALEIEKECMEGECAIDLPEMRMYDRRDEYMSTVLSQFKFPWVDPGRRALTAVSTKKKAFMKPVSFRFSFEKRLDKCPEESMWLKYLHLEKDVAVGISENPETLLASLPFVSASVCQFYFAGSKYELSLRMQEIEADGSKSFTTSGLEWVIGIAETPETAKAEQIEFGSNGLVDASCQDSFLEELSSIKDCVSLSRFVTVKVTLRDEQGGEARTYMARSCIDGFMPEDADYEYITEEGLFERGESVARSDLKSRFLVFETKDQADQRPPATPREQKMREADASDDTSENSWNSACHLRGMVSATQHYVLDLR